ncbi:MAG: helix-turn-helix transcriptional regulator [Phycisphaerae bacterium]|nr:helix-turn-helix transcriptional regulator [Phycisphaerae bacterium]
MRPSKLLAKLVADRDWKIGYLKRKVGLSRATVSRHVNGVIEPDIDQREKYAAAFKIPFDEFELMWQSATPLDPATSPSDTLITTPPPGAPATPASAAPALSWDGIARKERRRREDVESEAMQLYLRARQNKNVNPTDRRDRG